MPQTLDQLPEHLSPAQRTSLRELFLHELSIISCLFWRNTAPWDVTWRTCHDTFLLFPTKGRVRVHLEGRALTITPGHFLILADDTPHSLEIAKGQKHLHQFALHFHLHDRWKRSLTARFPSVTGTLKHPRETYQSLSELTCLLRRDPETGRDFGASFVQQLLADQIRKRPLTGASHPTGDQRIGHALAQMEADLASPDLSVEALARTVELTPVQFRKLFLRDIGQSPKQFLQQLRMRRSLHLLRHTAAPVKDIAAQCGFATDHYFHLAFHRTYHQTPTQYRTGTHSDI